MLDEKVVSTEEGAKLAKEFGVDFYECSAKNDINVEQSFLGIAKAVKDRLLADGGGAPGKPFLVILCSYFALLLNLSVIASIAANSGMKLKKDPVSGNRRANGCC